MRNWEPSVFFKGGGSIILALWYFNKIKEMFFGEDYEILYKGQDKK